MIYGDVFRIVFSVSALSRSGKVHTENWNTPGVPYILSHFDIVRFTKIEPESDGLHSGLGPDLNLRKIRVIECRFRIRIFFKVNLSPDPGLFNLNPDLGLVNLNPDPGPVNLDPDPKPWQRQNGRATVSILAGIFLLR